jgi:hypothetical protein
MAWSLFAKIAMLGCALAYAQDRPTLEIVKRVEGGQLQVSGRNVSGQPLVAYVVMIQSTDGTHTTVAKGVYTGADSMVAGGSEQLARIALNDKGEGEFRAVLDYVRLKDGTEAGPKATQEARTAAARFQN